ncbi:MAG: CAP domain-containing protein [Candidatus Methanofastidiosum sp.]|nr:CAP domain-containing protein [Methanofastidiosum sp.]
MDSKLLVLGAGAVGLGSILLFDSSLLKSPFSVLGLPISDKSKLLSLINQERMKAGARALSHDTTLEQIAQYWANECVKYNISEHYYNGSTPSIRAYQFGLTGTGKIYEILSKTYAPEKSVINFLNSPDHKYAMLLGSLSRAGVGIATYGDPTFKIYVINMM